MTRHPLTYTAIGFAAGAATALLAVRATVHHLEQIPTADARHIPAGLVDVTDRVTAKPSDPARRVRPAVTFPITPEELR